MDKTHKLQWLVLTIVVGFTAAVIFHYVIGRGRGYPYDTFLFRSDDRFRDLYNPLRGSADLDPYNPDRIQYVGGYFPFGYLIAFLLSLIHPKLLALLLFLGGFVIYLGLYLWRSIFGMIRPSPQDALSVFALTLMTYPVLFILDRANFDIIVFALLSLSIAFYARRNSLLSALLLAAAIAMKGYPAILLTLFVVDRRYKAFVIACVAAAGLTVGSLALFHGGPLVEFQKMMVSFARASAIAFGQGSLIRFNSSLYTAMLFIIQHGWPDAVLSFGLNAAYIGFAALIFLLTCLVMLKKEPPEWVKLTLLFALMILLPQSSGDYRLVMLYIPLVAYINNARTIPNDGMILMAFALLLVPKAYYVLENDVNIGLLLNPLLLIVLFGATIMVALKGSDEAGVADRLSGASAQARSGNQPRAELPPTPR